MKFTHLRTEDAQLQLPDGQKTTIRTDYWSLELEGLSRESQRACLELMHTVNDTAHGFLQADGHWQAFDAGQLFVADVQVEVGEREIAPSDGWRRYEPDEDNRSAKLTLSSRREVWNRMQHYDGSFVEAPLYIRADFGRLMEMEQ